MGTVCACGDGCALLVPFHGHSIGLLRRLCPPGSIPWAQTTHIHKKSARIISSLIRALFTIKS